MSHITVGFREGNLEPFGRQIWFQVELNLRSFQSQIIDIPLGALLSGVHILADVHLRQNASLIVLDPASSEFSRLVSESTPIFEAIYGVYP